MKFYCKKSYFNSNHLIFKSSTEICLFKKGKYYELDFPVYNGSVNCEGVAICCEEYDDYGKKILTINVAFYYDMYSYSDHNKFSDYFMTTKELRKEKLKKITCLT